MLLGLTPNTLRKIIAIAGLVALRVESMPLAEFDPSTLVMLGWGRIHYVVQRPVSVLQLMENTPQTGTNTVL